MQDLVAHYHRNLIPHYVCHLSFFPLSSKHPIPHFFLIKSLESRNNDGRSHICCEHGKTCREMPKGEFWYEQRCHSNHFSNYCMNNMKEDTITTTIGSSRTLVIHYLKQVAWARGKPLHSCTHSKMNEHDNAFLSEAWKSHACIMHFNYGDSITYSRDADLRCSYRCWIS